MFKVLARSSWLMVIWLLSGALPAHAFNALILDAQGQPVAGAVLSLAGEPQPKGPGTAVMDQVGMQFSPAVLAVATGTDVSFPNRDGIRHQVYSFSAPKRFELRLYEGTPGTPVTFDKPGLVVLGCNIHDWMLGYIYVTDDPWFAVSDEQGRVQLDLPAGNYPSTLWHPALVGMQPVLGQVQVGQATVELRLPVAVTAALQPAAPAPSSFADAFRKASRDAKP